MKYLSTAITASCIDFLHAIAICFRNRDRDKRILSNADSVKVEYINTVEGGGLGIRETGAVARITISASS